MPGGDQAGIHDDLIFDVGAHRGEDSAFYLALGYRVVAVEADPRLAQSLRQRFASDIADGRLTLVEAAIAERSGETIFYSNALPALSTARPAFAETNTRIGLASREVRVRAIRFEELLAEFGMPFYLKVDIEGSDELCLEALGSSGGRPPFLSVEASDWRWPDAVRQFRWLGDLGYRRFKIVRQGVHRASGFRTRSGDWIDHRFDHHSAGPFGNELSGEWLSLRQAMQRYRWIFATIRLRARDRLPGRLLGRLPAIRHLVGVPRWYDIHASR